MMVYFAFVDIERHQGVFKKILDQVFFLRRNRIDVKLVILTKTRKNFDNLDDCVLLFEYSDFRDLFFQYLAYLISPSKSNVFSGIAKVIENASVVYFRSGLFIPFFYFRLFSTLPSIIEINTDEENEFKLLGRDSFKYKVIYLYYLITRKRLFSFFNGSISVTHELGYKTRSFFKIDTKFAVVPNSIDSQKFEMYRPHGTNNVIPSLVFIGTPGYSWHGVDKIIELARVTRDILKFHIIGYSKDDFDNVPTNVVFYGFLSNSEYLQLFKDFDVGIGTLALSRKGMVEACPLKVREYISCGLPTMIGYKDTSFVGNVPSWILEVDENVTDSLMLKKIIDFSYRCARKEISVVNYKEFVDVKFIEILRLDFIRQFIS